MKPGRDELVRQPHDPEPEKFGEEKIRKGEDAVKRYPLCRGERRIAMGFHVLFQEILALFLDIGIEPPEMIRTPGQNAFDLRIDILLKKGNDLMANPVAEESGVPVGLIFPPGNAILLEKADEEIPRDIFQGTNEAHSFKLGLFAERSQSPESASLKEAQEKGLGKIVAVMREKRG